MWSSGLQSKILKYFILLSFNELLQVYAASTGNQMLKSVTLSLDQYFFFLLYFRPVLRAMLARLDKNTRKGTNLYAAFCLAFAGLLRMGEFTWARRELTPDFRNWHMTRGSILLSDDRVQLSLPVSKTDPFRQGVTLTISATGDEACAVAALKHLFARFPAPLNSLLFDTGHGFSRQLVTDPLRSILRELGFTGNYSDHSFRRGAATSAREACLSDSEIQLLGRWKSDAYKLYMQANPAII